MNSEDLIYATRDGRTVEFATGVWDNMPDDKYGWKEVPPAVPKSVGAALADAQNATSKKEVPPAVPKK